MLVKNHSNYSKTIEIDAYADIDCSRSRQISLYFLIQVFENEKYFLRHITVLKVSEDRL